MSSRDEDVKYVYNTFEHIYLQINLFYLLKAISFIINKR